MGPDAASNQWHHEITGLYCWAKNLAAEQKDRPPMKKKPGSSERKKPEETDVPAGQPVGRRFGRRWIILAAGGAAAAAAGAIALPGLFGSGPAKAGEIVVYKSPSCGCCGEWVKHLRQNGFEVSVNNIENVDPVRKQAGVPYDMASCHTALVDGYAVEGHVPAENIRKMLADRPNFKGLVVPGMPASAPGMDGSDPEPYTVYSFDAAGKSEVYASY
jgi:hypothetical protein